jgi:broad specificity phosphatase PhoE
VTLSQVIAIRHGESRGNVAREEAEAEGAERISIDQRDPDVALSERGRQQAAAVGVWLAEFAAAEPISAVWSSPYVRARQTAEIALGTAEIGCPLGVDERLRDRELGILDLLTSRGVVTRFPEEAQRRRWLGKLYYRPPGGESWADVALRLRSFLGDLDRRTSGTAVLFCHDAVITLLRYVLEELDEASVLALARSTVVGNGSVTRIVRSADGGWCTAVFADDDHVRELGAPATDHPGEVDDAHR